MRQSVRVRIYPNGIQKKLIADTFECCRLVYNRGLAMRRDTYNTTGSGVSYKQTCAMLTALKREDEFSFLKEVDSVALQQSLWDLDKAYKRFFLTKKNYPKFKTKRGSNKYRTNNANNSIRFTSDGECIRLPKLGYVKVKAPRDLRVAKIKSVIIERTSANEYFATLT